MEHQPNWAMNICGVEKKKMKLEWQRKGKKWWNVILLQDSATYISAFRCNTTRFDSQNKREREKIAIQLRDNWKVLFFSLAIFLDSLTAVQMVTRTNHHEQFFSAVLRLSKINWFSRKLKWNKIAGLCSKSATTLYHNTSVSWWMRKWF